MPDSVKCICEDLMKRGVPGGKGPFEKTLFFRGLEESCYRLNNDRIKKYTLRCIRKRVDADGHVKGLNRPDYPPDLAIAMSLQYASCLSDEDGRYEEALDEMMRNCRMVAAEFHSPHTLFGNCMTLQDVYSFASCCCAGHSYDWEWMDDEDDRILAAERIIEAWECLYRPSESVLMDGRDVMFLRVRVIPNEYVNASHAKMTGLFLLGLCDVLESLSSWVENERCSMEDRDYALKYKDTVLRIYAQLCEKTLFRAKDGLFGDDLRYVISEKNPPETFGSCLITYALLKGLYEKWLDDDIQDDVFGNFRKLQMHVLQQETEGEKAGRYYVIGAKPYPVSIMADMKYSPAQDDVQLGALGAYLMAAAMYEELVDALEWNGKTKLTLVK